MRKANWDLREHKVQSEHKEYKVLKGKEAPKEPKAPLALKEQRVPKDK